MKRRGALALLVVLGATAVAVAGITTAAADVAPAEFSATLDPGQSATVTKTVTLPEVTPRLDLVLDVDLSGSYGDDLPAIKSLAPGIYDGVVAAIPDSMFGLVTFVDYPFSPWGSSGSGDYAYARNQDLTADKTAWTGAINAMGVRFGGDEPESQLESLYQAATGLGRDVPPVGSSPGDVPAGEGISWRTDATKVLAITTDASMHVAGDSLCTFPSPPCAFPYPGPSFADAVAALNAKGIVVIAIKAPGSTPQMDALAAATGGVVKTTGSSSAEIADAILDALEELTFTVTGSPVGCDPLEITFDPASHTGVSGGASVDFEETITVPDGTAPGTYECTVEFKAGDAVVGIQTITIEVPDPVIEVEIDVKPGSDPNSWGCRAVNGLVPVAVLSSSTFDATTLDANSVRWGKTGTEAAHAHKDRFGDAKRHVEDVNGDGLADMVFHFRFRDSGFSCADIPAGQKEATLPSWLTGMTTGGDPVIGTDVIRLVG